MTGERELLQRDLNHLYDKIKSAGFDLVVNWTDEYGGLSSVKLVYGDHLKVVEKK